MSSYNNTLTYEPLSALKSQLSLELPKISDMGLLDDVILTDMVVYCIRDLGIRVFHRKEKVLTIEDGRTEMPYLLHSINFIALCLDREVCEIKPQGQHVWMIELDNSGKPKFLPIGMQHHSSPITSEDKDCKECTDEQIGVDCCGRPILENNCSKDDTKVFLACEGRTKFQVWQVLNGVTHRFKSVVPLIQERNHADNLMACEDCNLSLGRFNTFRKIGNAFYFNIKEGSVYINYMAYPYDEDKNEILIPADPIIWNYISYYIKYRILQNMIINGQDDNIKTIYQDVKQDYLAFRHQAKSLVNTPSYRQIREAWIVNRRIMTEIFYRPFVST